MTPESGAVELLALEFQPPHYSACACGFGLAAPGKAPPRLRKCLHLGRGSCAPAPISCGCKCPGAQNLKQQGLPGLLRARLYNEALDWKLALLVDPFCGGGNEGSGR